MRSLVIGGGVALVVVSLGAVPLLACSCASPPPPSMATCDGAGEGAMVETVTIDEVQPVSGAQGGRHVEIVVTVAGTGLGDCIAQRTEVRVEDRLQESNESNVPLHGSDTLATSGAILIFPFDLSWQPGTTLTVQIGGVTAERVLESARVDGGALDSSVVDSSVADSSVVDSSVGDSSVADSSVVDSSVVDSSVVDAD